MILTFTDLQPNQLCTFVRALDFGIQDVCIGIRTTDDQFITIYSMNNNPLPPQVSITGEYLRRSCSFVSAGEVQYIDPLNYPEVCL